MCHFWMLGSRSERLELLSERFEARFGWKPRFGANPAETGWKVWIWTILKTICIISGILLRLRCHTMIYRSLGLVIHSDVCVPYGMSFSIRKHHQKNVRPAGSKTLKWCVRWSEDYGMLEPSAGQSSSSLVGFRHFGWYRSFWRHFPIVLTSSSDRLGLQNLRKSLK